jgi:hypothetical protein
MVMGSHPMAIPFEFPVAYAPTLALSSDGSGAKKIAFHRRRQKAIFSHHVEVCRMDETDVQDRFLVWCEEPLALNRAHRTHQPGALAARHFIHDRIDDDFPA